MKNLFTTAIAVFLFVLTANAQETTQLVSKKGVPILPKAGDYSIGVDASPFINYFGNLMNGETFNNEGAGFKSAMGQTITGKYFTSDNTAIRAMFRFGMTSEKDKTYSSDDVSVDPDALVEDVMKDSETNITIGLGLEKRRGAGRVQGVYGAMLDFGIESSKTTYEYGNAITATNTTPTRSIGGLGFGTSYLEQKNASIFEVGLSGFVGVEYFFAPKMSLGGEFMYGLMYESTGEGVEKIEYWNGSAVETDEAKTAGGSFFGLDTNIGGSIYLSFYF
jgi:hypothetical protein